MPFGLGAPRLRLRTSTIYREQSSSLGTLNRNACQLELELEPDTETARAASEERGARPGYLVGGLVRRRRGSLLLSKNCQRHKNRAFRTTTGDEDFRGPFRISYLIMQVSTDESLCSPRFHVCDAGTEERVPFKRVSTPAVTLVA